MMIMTIIISVITCNFVLLSTVYLASSSMVSLSHSSPMQHSSAVCLDRLALMSWNASGIMSSGMYLGRTLDDYDIDICGISEHWLYKKDLQFFGSINNSYKYYAVSDFDLDRPSRRRVGKGGVALLWKRTINNRISVLDLDDDRLIGIQYQLSKDTYMYIIQVYLPSANHNIGKFEEYLFRLQDLCSIYSDRGTLILIGDFNSHLNGVNFIKRHDRRSILFSNFLRNNNLVSANTLQLCTGASCSFVSYSREYASLIDHIILPIEKQDLILQCEILDDDALNVSAHRPIFCSVRTLVAQADSFRSFFSNTVRWRCVKSRELNCYSQQVEIACSSNVFIKVSPITNRDIDVLYDDVVQIVQLASDRHLPHTKEFKEFLKPYWNHTLKDLHKSMREKRKIWIADNRPRGNNFTSYKNYKAAKRMFRQYHRKCAENHLRSINEEIDKAAELDCKYFWKLVNRKRTSCANNVGNEIIFNNCTYRDPENICNQWGLYFSSLYRKSENENYIAENYANVTSCVTSIKQKTLATDSVIPITERELNNAVDGLSKGKACGNDRVDNEHIIYSGSQFRRALLFLYNTMLIKSYIPPRMKTGIIITLFKGGNKRKDDPNSYRAITLTSVILKLFERILYQRLLSSFSRPLNSLQGGFQKNMGCNMTSFLLHECIYYAQENNSRLYVCFLDAKKSIR